MAVSAFVSLQIYNGESGKQAWVEYLVIGTVVAVSLEMVSKSFPVYEKKMELSYILMEVLESGNIDKVRDRESLLETEPERDTSSENREEEFSKERQEQVLNQVIGEFLQ
jgi:hypothetical protein